MGRIGCREYEPHLRQPASGTDLPGGNASEPPVAQRLASPCTLVLRGSRNGEPIMPQPDEFSDNELALLDAVRTLYDIVIGAGTTTYAPVSYTHLTLPTSD